MNLSDQQRSNFFAKINKDRSGCWLWTGSRHAFGYGWVRIKRTTYLSHRISFVIHRGQIPHGAFVLHSCDRPSCVNPQHLRIGTQRDNVSDMMRRRRHFASKRKTCASGHALIAINLYGPYKGAGEKICKLCARQRSKDAYWHSRNAR